MDNQIIETVLKEILDEQAQTNQLNRENTHALIEQGNRLKAIEKSLYNKQLAPALPDNKKVENIFETGIKKITEIIADQPRQVIHQKRILLFPEYNTNEYYKIVFGRVLGWLVLLIIATYLFVLGKGFIAAYQENDMYRQGYEQLLKEKQESDRKVKQKSKVKPQ
jgi:hypothetical protein